MSTDRAIAFAAIVAAWSLGLAACPGTLDDKQRFLTGSGGAADCGDVPRDILAAKCGGSGCHGPTKPAEDLDLESDGVASRVIGVPATGCDGILADPADPERSVLYRKLLPFGVPGCGVPMPFARATLPIGEIACVRDWIAEQIIQPSPDAGDDDAGDGD